MLVVDAVASDRLPHGGGLYEESKEFVRYYKAALNFQAEKEAADERKRQQEIERARTEGQIILPSR